MGLYVSAVLGLLETAEKVTDKTVALLLPFVLRGLSSEVVDHVSATYMVIGQLARRTVLSREFVDELITRICKVRHTR